jgi:hypothetical protein
LINLATFRDEAKPVLLPSTAIRAVLLGRGGLWIGQDDPKARTPKGIFTFVEAQTGQTREMPGPFMRGPSAFADQALWVTNTWSKGTYLDRVRP